MASNKDFYQILGVNKNSTPEEIKQAYRKLAREHHPDMVKDGDKASAEQRFKEINEAYQILSDPQKRKMFDQYGSAAFANGAQGPQGAGGFGQQGQWGPFSYTYTTGGNGQDFGFGQDFDPFDVFEQFFGFRGYGGQANRQPRKGKNLYYQLQVSFRDAIFGIEKEIKVESGKVKIKVPAGVRNGMELRFSGYGMPGPENTPAGDLFLSINIETPEEFELYEDYLYLKKEIKYSLAALGGTIDVPVVDLKEKTGIGTTKLKIPEGTQYGTKFLLKGKGMPRLRGSGQGDVIVQVFITVPKKVSREDRALLEKLGS